MEGEGLNTEDNVAVAEVNESSDKISLPTKNKKVIASDGISINNSITNKNIEDPSDSVTGSTIITSIASKKTLKSLEKNISEVSNENILSSGGSRKHDLDAFILKTKKTKTKLIGPSIKSTGGHSSTSLSRSRRQNKISKETAGITDITKSKNSRFSELSVERRDDVSSTSRTNKVKLSETTLSTRELNQVAKKKMQSKDNKSNKKSNETRVQVGLNPRSPRPPKHNNNQVKLKLKTVRIESSVATKRKKAPPPKVHPGKFPDETSIGYELELQESKDNFSVRSTEPRIQWSHSLNLRELQKLVEGDTSKYPRRLSEAEKEQLFSTR